MTQVHDTEDPSLDLVRRRILAITWVGITVHALVAMVATAGWLADQGRQSDAVIMLITSVPTALAIYGVTRVILQKPLVSLTALPWIALTLAPLVVGIVWVF